MIKGMIFDFGNVICKFDNHIFTNRLAKHTPCSGEGIYRMIYDESDLSGQYEEGRLSSAEFYQKVKEICNVDMDIGHFREAFTDIFTTIPETIELIRKLKGGYKLGLLSNTNEWDHEHAIRKVEIYQLFDAVTVSCEVGVKKPDERIYLDCLEKLGLQPNECIYIDDVLDYSEKASELGMIGHQYIDHQDLLLFLTKNGIDLVF